MKAAGGRCISWPIGLPVDCYVNGTRAHQSASIEDGSIIAFGPSVRGVPELIVFLITTAIVNLAIYAINGLTRRKIDQPDGLDADQSPSFAWNGAETTYGDGFFTPVSVGTIRLHGHVVSMDIEPEGLSERMHILIELGFGPFHSIGGIRNAVDVDSRQPTAPRLTSLEINGVAITDDIQASLIPRWTIRMGTIAQPPAPLWLSRPSSVISVNFHIVEWQDSVTVVIPDTKAVRGRLQLDWPQGLYRQDPQGNYSNVRIDFNLEVRARGQTVFTSLPIVSIDENNRDPFSSSFEFTLPVPPGNPPGFDGYEVRITRQTNLPPLPVNEFRQTQAVVNRVVYSALDPQSYPQVALIGLSILANAQFAGARPQVSVVSETQKVRLYDESIGLSEPTYFDFPEIGDPYEGIWQNVKPGDNPAWQAIYLFEADEAAGPLRYKPIYQLFRNWADFCDELSLRSAFTFDQPAPVLDQLNSTVFQAGRAIMVRSGRHVFPVYWFRDAHGRGANFIPEKAPVAVVCGSNCESWQVSYVPNHQRANRISGQIRSAEDNYTLQPVAVNDPDVNTSDATKRSFVPVRDEQARLNAVTDPFQARRHLWWLMKEQQLSDRELTVTLPIEFVYFRIGDNFLFQAEKYLALSGDVDEDARFSSRLFEDATTGSSSIKLKKGLELPQSGYYGCAIYAGLTVVKRTIDATSQQSFAIGEAIPLTDALPVGVKRDQSVIVGLRSDVDPGETPPVAGEEYQATGFTLESKFKVRIRASKWAPEAFDDPPGSVLAATGAPATPPQVPGKPGNQPDPEVLDVDRVAVTKDPSGQYRISWMMPPGYIGRSAGVSVRAVGSSTWRNLGESSSMSMLVAALPIDRRGRMEIRIAPYLEELGLASPTAAAVEVHVPEFHDRPIATPGRLRAQVTGDSVGLTWDAVPDADYYEIRRGRVWDGGPCLATTEGTDVVLRDLARGARTYQVRARRRSGAWSPVSAYVNVEWTQLDDSIELVTEDVAGGTADLDDMEADDGSAVLSAQKLTGVASLSVSHSSPIVALWTCEVDFFESMPGLTRDHPLSDVPLLSGEGHFRGSYTREPSGRFPGVDLTISVADLDDGTVSMDESLLRGVGKNTSVELEVRWDTSGNGSFDAWEPFRPQRRRAKAAEFRAICRRRSTDYQIHIERIRAQVQS